VNTLVQEASKILTAATAIIKTLTDGIRAMLPLVRTAATNVMTAITDTLRNLQSRIRTAGQNLVTTFTNAIKGAMNSIRSVGQAIVTGVWNGIVARQAWFTAQVRNFFLRIINAVKSALGISSPSKVFAGIGESMVAGLARGWSESIEGMKRDMQRTIREMSGMSLSLAGAPSLAGNLTPSPFPEGKGSPTINVTQSFTFNGGGGDEGMMDEVRRVTEAGILEAVRQMQSGRRQRW